MICRWKTPAFAKTLLASCRISGSSKALARFYAQGSAGIWGDINPLVQDTFVFPALRIGQLVALQPERGIRTDRDADYHDISRVPCHGYVAFVVLQTGIHADAVIHIGALALEWLPEAVALSAFAGRSA